MINNLANNLKIKYTKASIPTISAASLKDCEIGPITTTTTYVNNLPIDIVVVDRSGFRHTVPSTYSAFDPTFSIHVMMRIRHQSVNEVRKFLSFISTDNNQELKIIKEIILDQNEQRFYAGLSVCICHRVTLEEIKDNNGSIYINSKDIVLSSASLINAPAHPYAEDTISDNFFMGTNNLDQELGCPTTKIEIVDNNLIIGERFVLVLGAVRKIIPKTDIKRDSGVYVTTLEPNVVNDSGYSIITKRYELDEMESSLLIFRTKDLAISSGDAAGVRKEELIRMDHANNLLKQEFIKQKQEFDFKLHELQSEKSIETLELEKENITLKRQNDRLEHEREIDKAERKDYYDRISQERKDYYEKTSQGRKESLDIMKFLPAAIMAMGAIYMALSKVPK